MIDDNIERVIAAADEAEPRVAGTADMGPTLKSAQRFLADYGFKQVQIDRWDHDNGCSVEMGYAHGEVWYRVWKRQEREQWPVYKLRAVSLHPNDLESLSEAIHQVMGYYLETEE